MAEAIVAAIGVSLLLYLLFGGADFGAGILELIVGRRAEPYVDRALSPVWETNHVWLILAVVLTFIAFPDAFAVVSTYLHLPLSVALLGIVARGVAFTFRHYDPAPTGTRLGYTWAFRISSVVTPFFLGVAFAAAVEGRLHARLEEGFVSVFVTPWLSPFALSVGVFVCTMCVFVAASLLAAERGPRATGALPYLRVARASHLATVAAGGVVLGIAWRGGLPHAEAFLSSPVSVASVVLATALIPVVAWSFGRAAVGWLRLAVAGQVVSIVGGFAAAQLPVLARVQGEAPVTYVTAAAPDATLRALLFALVVGAVLIVPGVFALFRVYKSAPASSQRSSGAPEEARVDPPEH